ncbi:MAG: cell division topological specificity factor MinE [bacterium]
MKAINETLSDIIAKLNRIFASSDEKLADSSKSDACNRLKLVLMHDRSNISPETLQKMRDEMVEVISKYVEIDRDALDLCLESESNTIALVANIPILRSK